MRGEGLAGVFSLNVSTAAGTAASGGTRQARAHLRVRCDRPRKQAPFRRKITRPRAETSLERVTARKSCRGPSVSADMVELATEKTIRGMATRVQAAPAAVLVTDSAGRVLAASNPMCALVGWTRVELLTLGLADLGIPAQAEPPALATGSAFLRHRDGTTIPVRLHVTRLDLASGPLYHWVVQPSANGLGNREIALELSVSLETVKSHIRRVLEKMDARSRAHAVAIAWRQ